MVSHQSRVGTPAAAGKFWRIQDHRIELFALLDELVERLEAVTAFKPDTLEAVDLSICADPRYSRFAAVDAEHFGGATNGRGCHCEAAGVAEHVEHTLAAEVFGSGETVFALVEIEARFLAGAEIDFVRYAVFADENWPIGQFAPNVAIGKRN